MFRDQLPDLSDWINETQNADGEKPLDVMISKSEQYGGKTYNIPLEKKTSSPSWRRGCNDGIYLTINPQEAAFPDLRAFP
jgi:hypothetical protein